ncbi:elongator complex protein 3 [Phosphitispora sp. TUW77]|uniref:elongator complex protein 3 n=1 Tax=Phosphitispora sp. TUW77 TaxID=3152361 RepID=UPI003AB56901
MSKSHYIIPVFVPDLGCPHRCVFCNQKKITGLEQIPNGSEVRRKIESYLETMPKDDGVVKEVAFYGGSFTAVDKALQRELLKPAYDFMVKGDINFIRVSTRPDTISEDILLLLAGYGVSTVELGVQSMEDEVLWKSGRGHTSRDVLRAVALIKSWGLRLGLQMMVGLPGATEAGDLYTGFELTALAPDFVRIYPCLVLKGTRLEELYLNGNYAPLELSEAVSRCKKLLVMFEREGINVIRIGLQPSEQINLTGDVIAGPFHPSFRELVESAVSKDMLEYMLEVADITRARELVLEVPEKDISVVRGHLAANVKYFTQKLGLESLITKTNSSLARGSIKIISIDGQKVCSQMGRIDLVEGYRLVTS